MKKFFFIPVVLLSMLTLSVAQTTLPTSFDFETAPSVLPLGWSTNTNSFYSTGNSGKAGKLNSTGHYYQIDLLDEPGQITYYIRSFGTSTFAGTFELEESIDGNSWTSIRVFGNGDFNDSYTQFTDTADRDSRFIRFNLSNKVSGTNVGLDDVNIMLAPPPETAEINVKAGTTDIPSGQSYAFSSPVGTPTTLTLTIENIGTDSTLTVGTPTITQSGSDYSITSSPSSVPNASSANLEISFNPSAAGTIPATLSIPNNDSNEDPYTIDLIGIGGNFASEPAAQPTNLTFSDIKSYTFDASFTDASTVPDGYIVLRRDGAAVTDVPADGNAYGTGDVIGNSKVVYSGSDLNFTPNFVIANSDYHFAIFSYNGPEAFRNYLETAPLTGSVTSLGSMQGNYYGSIQASHPDFIEDLQAIISNPYNQIFYSNYTLTLINEFYKRDTVNGQKVITCSYSGEQRVYSEPFDYTSNNFSREHVFARSWMPNPTTSTDTEEGSDLHNLLPVNQTDVNAVRSNYPFDDVTNVTSTYLDATFGDNAGGDRVYEPRDEIKGDVARAIFYMCLRWDGQDAGGLSWGIPTQISTFINYGQDQDLLKQWHWDDPPSALEIARNDYIQSVQDNRNPFIDSTHFVCYIDFYTMTHLPNASAPCFTTGIDDQPSSVTEWSVFPNPNNGEFTLDYFATDREDISIRLLDITGKVIMQKCSAQASGYHQVQLGENGLSAGVYLVEFNTGNNIETRKVIVR